MFLYYLLSAFFSRLGIRAGECSVQNKPNKETIVDIKQSVRDRQVFIIQTGTKDVNNHIMELLIMIYACKTSSSKSITVVMPYLPYSKQCKMRKRSSITCKLLADMIVKAGANKLITMDLYRKEIQGFFNIPVDNLRASPFLLQYIVEKIPDYKNAVIVAKNPGVINKATSYAERLRIGIAVIHGEPKEPDSEELDGRGSPPLGGHPTGSVSRKQDSNTFATVPLLSAKEKPPLTIVGDVGGHIAIMVDYMIDEVQSFVAAADLLQELGAYKIYVVATHGLLSADAPQLLEDSAIDEVVVTNTVPHDVQKMQCHKIKTVDVSVMFSEAIRRSFYQESMSYLFRDVAMDD
uniref:Ribose-phosphate pyrophosphokinase N-terminal domain-containing protein n=1 Tax=Romanomermis culicivorax TaxID=13658 RepID=A0A915HQZ7_ROMCU